jgi:hypothetical protein
MVCASDLAATLNFKAIISAWKAVFFQYFGFACIRGKDARKASEVRQSHNPQRYGAYL